MSEIQEQTLSSRKIESESRHGETRQVAIVGLNRETADLLPGLLDAEGIQVIKVLNPEHEDLSRLTLFPHLDVIIDTTGNPTIAARLRKLPLKKVDVISGLGARVLFCSIRNGQPGMKNGILRSLEEIRESARHGKSKAEVLKIILNTAVKAMTADCGSVMLLDPSRRQLTIEAAYGLEESVVVSAIQRVGKGISGCAIRRGESILTNGAVDRLAFSADHQRPEIASSICCPLMSGNEAVGVINIASKDPAHLFAAADVEYLEELGRLSAEVIKTSRDAESHQTASCSPGLMDSAREILSMKYRFEERLNLLLMKMANAFGAKDCTYYEYNSTDRRFTAKASSSAGLALLREKPVLLDDLFSQRVIKSGSTFCVNSTGKAPRSKKWYMLQPIRSGNELAGTLFVHLASEKNQLKEEMALLKKIGDLLAREVSRNRDLETIKGQSIKHSAISQFTFDIANAAGLPEASRMILSSVRQLIDAETCVLRLRNSPSEELAVRGSMSNRNPVWMQDILAVDAAIAADLSPGKGAIKIDKLRESRYRGENLASDSLLAMSLEINGEALGALTLYDKKSADATGGGAFTDQDKEVLLNFGLQAAKGLKRFLPFPSWTPVADPGTGLES
jgi:GAF domain-containing protein